MWSSRRSLKRLRWKFEPHFSQVFGGSEIGSERWAMISTVLLVVLILLLIGVLPIHGYAANWGYGPSGIVGVLVVVLLILLLTGRL